MSKRNNYKDGLKDNDYPIDCADCGQTCWFSQSTKLGNETSKGGLTVCPNCVYATDWGALPYVVGPEESVKDSAQYQQSTVGGVTNIDFTTYDPMSGDLPE